MKELVLKMRGIVALLVLCAFMLCSCDGVGTGGEQGNGGGDTVVGGDGNEGGDNNSTGDGNDTNVGGPIPDVVDPVTSDPYTNVSAEEFYASYTPAVSYNDSRYRTEHGFMSGSIEVPDAAPTVSAYQPREDGLLIKNTGFYYSGDGNTYYVLDGYGEPVLCIYRGGAYITLEEVAAHMYAFGELPANYTSKKSGKPTSDPWGEYLRLNHSYFSGDIARYPYEPRLPNINGSGGDLQYYEMDIGTTGTYTDHRDDGKPYNNGTKITRGAARIVYGRSDLNKNGSYDVGELYLFYTYNHYNDFQEYLNYYGGWGAIFGNITGGGELSSDTDCNPTPYVEVSLRDLRTFKSANAVIVVLPLKMYSKRYTAM